MASISTYHHYSNLKEDKFLKLTDSIKNLFDKLIHEGSFDDNEFKYFLGLESLVGRSHKYLNYSFTRKNIDKNYVKSNSYPDFFKGIDLKNEDFIEVPLFMMNLFTYSGLMSKNNLDSINDVDLSHLKFVKTDTTFIKSEKIREQLLYVTAFFNIEHTNNLDTFYKTYDTSTNIIYLKNIIEKNILS
ncbi:MAG: hypothetical protein ACI83B_001775 [Sediminicola sp.]